MQVSEGSDAQTVAGVKLRLQEFTANLPDVHQLEEAGSWKQHLEAERAKTFNRSPSVQSCARACNQ